MSGLGRATARALGTLPDRDVRCYFWRGGVIAGVFDVAVGGGALFFRLSGPVDCWRDHGSFVC